MKLIHLADLHIGKRVNEISMIEDQRYVLQQVVEWIEEEQADGVLIAGDVYDKQVPSIEAVQLLDTFLTELARRKLPVYLISGNHDAAERVAFGARLLEKSHIYVAARYQGKIDKITIPDAYGNVNLYLLPFLKPAQVRAVWKEEAEHVTTYQDAIDFVLAKEEIKQDERNILVAHQFVAGAQTCDSEERTIGGLDQIAASSFQAFDYVALGHLHGPQQVSRETIRYAGTLLKYSFSEISHKKSITMVELGEKGQVKVRTKPVHPLHDMRQIRGTYEELVKREHYENTETADYLRIILTDEEDVYDAIGKLRVIYPNLMRLEYDNTRTRSRNTVDGTEAVEQKTPIAFAEELYCLQNNRPMNETQRNYMEKMIQTIWEEEA